ncbi:MAG: hypothetical protein ACR2FV_12535 [Ornithinimicrobium sp.]|uniref:hypothetical protein n=1 Tax=Ornithinimicrobium sp. TaxID=1977084 RepID=UPI003D9BD294
MHPTHIPLRLATGAFILNSGLGKLGADEETAQTLHGTASTAYPFLEDMKPKDFAELLAYGEIALGTALLAPMVPSTVAGTGLAAFGGALFGMYLKLPGMTMDDGIRPTQDGLAFAKDIWMVGAGITLATQGALGAAKSTARSVSSSARGLASDIGQSTRDALPFG